MSHYDYEQQGTRGDLIELAIRMREAQKRYFQTRDRNDLVTAKQLEREFDQRAK